MGFANIRQAKLAPGDYTIEVYTYNAPKKSVKLTLTSFTDSKALTFGDSGWTTVNSSAAAGDSTDDSTDDTKTTDDTNSTTKNDTDTTTDDNTNTTDPEPKQVNPNNEVFQGYWDQYSKAASKINKESANGGKVNWESFVYGEYAFFKITKTTTMEYDPIVTV